MITVRENQQDCENDFVVFLDKPKIFPSHVPPKSFKAFGQRGRLWLKTSKTKTKNMANSKTGGITNVTSNLKKDCLEDFEGGKKSLSKEK